MAVTVRPLHPLFVGELSGVDITQPLTRDEVAAGHPKVPPRVSISFRLIEQWFDAGGRKLGALADVSTWTTQRQAPKS